MVGMKWRWESRKMWACLPLCLESLRPRRIKVNANTIYLLRTSAAHGISTGMSQKYSIYFPKHSLLFLFIAGCSAHMTALIFSKIVLRDAPLGSLRQADQNAFSMLFVEMVHLMLFSLPFTEASLVPCSVFLSSSTY